MKNRFLLILLAGLLCAARASADEGMWLPSLIGNRIEDMRSKGFRLTAEDIYSINRASLKDAIVHFGGGCTGELVSDRGLLLTNHHCGYSQIQSHSSVEHDYLTDGFWAMSPEQELPNPGLTVSFLVRMEDVTGKVLKGVKADDDEAARRAKMGANIERITEKATEKGRYRASVEALYYGNQYFLFVYNVYRDVRLVAAPPSSIGKFGGDTDNWMWPRHTGDFSVFRVYADKNNDPADYSPDNVPYRPKRHFTVSTRGVSEGDFTMIYGFPGTTREYVTSDYVDYTLNFADPVKIGLRTRRLDVISAAQQADARTRIQYASKHANIANAWKKWQGESLGLARLGTVGKKRAYEERFQQWARSRAEYADVLPELRKAYAEWRPYAEAYDYFSEAFSAIELNTPAAVMAAAAKAGTTEGAAARVASFYKNYDKDIDRTIAEAMLAEYLEHVPARFVPAHLTQAVAEAGGVKQYVAFVYQNSALTSEAMFRAATANETSVADAMRSDPFMTLYTAFRRMFEESVREPYVAGNAAINALYSRYMRALMEFDTERTFYPDANSTLRVAYGRVGGYRPNDGVYHRHYTTLDGIIEKDDPTVYDYDIPQSLRDIYASKEYGRWGVECDGRVTVPVAFIASNHTTGGNSGSPVLDADGRLLGINFDRTWVSTMSDIEFDPEICRNIAVDIRYVLFVIDKIGGAGYLIDEMTLAE